MNKKVYIMLSLLFVVIGSILIMHSSYFQIQEIQVIGNHQLDVEQIIKASGIEKGQNIFLIPGREIVTRLMNYVRIKGVKLERAFPDTLVIRVNERTGLALFPAEEGKWIEVSRDGLILEVYQDNLPKLPLVEGIELQIQGKHVIMTEELKDALTLFKTLVSLQEKMTQVSYREQDIQIQLMNGIQVVIGRAADPEQKGELLLLILANQQDQLKNIEHVDLRFDGKPFIRKKR